MSACEPQKKTNQKNQNQTQYMNSRCSHALKGDTGVGEGGRFCSQKPNEDTRGHPVHALFLNNSSMVLEPHLTASSSTVEKGLVGTSFMKYTRPI